MPPLSEVLEVVRLFSAGILLVGGATCYIEYNDGERIWFLVLGIFVTVAWGLNVGFERVVSSYALFLFLGFCFGGAGWGGEVIGKRLRKAKGNAGSRGY